MARTFGEIPGHPEGTTYARREDAIPVNAPLRAGISGSGRVGADSIVVSRPPGIRDGVEPVVPVAAHRRERRIAVLAAKHAHGQPLDPTNREREIPVG
jgi:hypothetical protein